MRPYGIHLYSLPHRRLGLERVFQTRESGGGESIVSSYFVEDILDTLDEALVVGVDDVES